MPVTLAILLLLIRLIVSLVRDSYPTAPTASAKQSATPASPITLSLLIRANVVFVTTSSPTVRFATTALPATVASATLHSQSFKLDALYATFRTVKSAKTKLFASLA